ncbi:Hypothetical predicted protein [Scomber scombrus]|uniref:Uncharacterized protein n=1 Tax=Scomber scombrus TaxID=13677 RepID=A0AAV1P1A4_SCOSC
MKLTKPKTRCPLEGKKRSLKKEEKLPASSWITVWDLTQSQESCDGARSRRSRGVRIEEQKIQLCSSGAATVCNISYMTCPAKYEQTCFIKILSRDKNVKCTATCENS